MQINRQNNQKIINNFAKKASIKAKEAISKSKNLKTDLALVSAAVSGAYIAKKSMEKQLIINELTNLGFDKKSAKTIENMRDEKNEKLFDKTNINLFLHLKETYPKVFNDILKNPNDIAVSKIYQKILNNLKYAPMMTILKLH